MNDAFMNTYHRMNVTLKSGRGSILFDVDGRRYIDFTAGIAVNCLGHSNPELLRAISAQAKKIIHSSNYFETETANSAAKKLIAIAGMKKVFFCNSGAEANECAIKIARKYSFKKYGEGRHKIVTLTGSFHGRTITTLSATGQPKFHVNFGPFTEGFSFVPPNDIDALEAAVSAGDVCAFMIEVIQGEGGVNPLDGAYVKKAAELCAQRDILLIVDEVQTGVGRTGKFFAHEHFGVKADIATLAKGLAGGIPVGACLAGVKTENVLESGDHGSTFGGNPLACAAMHVVLSKLENTDFLTRIGELGDYLMDGLRRISKIKNVRGKGLMIGADIETDAWAVIVKLAEAAKTEKEGALVLTAGTNTLRFLPPYTISKKEIDRGLALLEKVITCH